MKLKNKYKIALVGFRLSKGGAERQMANLSIYLDRIGVEVHHILVNNEVTYPHAGKVFKTRDKEKGYGIFSRLTRFWSMYKYIKKEKFDYIIDFRFRNKHLQEFLINRLIYAKSQIYYRIESYALEHYMPKSIFLAKLIYNNSKGLICLTNKMEQKVKQIYDFKHTHVINNSFINENLDNVSNDIIEDDFILAIGNMENEYKQFDHLIEAYSMINHESKLFILGEGKLQSKYEKIAESYLLTDKVFFLGFKENIYNYMRKAKFLVLSSKVEGFANVLIESLAMGTPVVSYDVNCGPSEIIINEYNGLLIENQSIEALASGMNRFLNDEKLYNFCKNNAKQSVEKFHMDTIGSKWDELLSLI